jgi:hypothetical protein
MPSLGIRFDIEKLEEHDSSIYARPAWEIVFKAFGLTNFSGETDLFEGDTSGTVSGSEYVYCLGIHNNDVALLKRIRTAVDNSEEFNAVANATRFVEGTALSSEPLVHAAHIDGKGDFEIKPGSCLRLVLAKLRKEERSQSAADIAAVDRKKPASKRSTNLPEIKSLDKLESMLLKRFSHHDAHPDMYFFLTPEELCDVVERYDGVFRAYWKETEGSSGDEIEVRMTEPFEYNNDDDTDVETLEFTGLCAFASNADAVGYCRNNEFNPARWGVQGAFATYFQGSSGNSLWSWEKEEFRDLYVSADDLWKKICERRAQLGIANPKPSGKSQHSEAPSVPVSKKWWEFWK